MNSPLYNRIKKNGKQLKPFLAREGITCYRVFDWDMPEYPLCIDVYEDKIHAAIYQTRHELDEDAYQDWLDECMLVMMSVFNLEKADIYIKTRERKKALEQYEKVDDVKDFFTVKENGIKFLVNLNDYLDTGLFLDHRNTRKQVMLESTGKHVLNLFAYTGAFSVYAAMGGAFTTTTVDLSNTYLKWARNNFILNEIPLGKHQFIKADVKEWIMQNPSRLYDIIVLDPPTLSKSKMAKTTFEVQADHVDLVNHSLKHLQTGGVLFFSNNFRGFVLDEKNILATSIENITAGSIPFDFRNKKIHMCWRMVK